MSGRTIIHLNGRDYEANSGSLRPIHQPRTIDGFVRAAPSAVPTQPARSVTPPVHAVRKPQKAQTLSRNAVRKPHMSDIRPSHQPVQTRRPSAPAANAVPRSEHIRRFSPQQHQPTAATMHSTPTPAIEKEEVPAASYLPRSKKEMLVDGQLQKATAHTEPALKEKRKFRRRLANMSPFRRRFATIGAGTLAVVLIGGFIVYNNLTGISLTIANRRAGFTAMLPTYTPGGYSLDGPVSYSPGRVILKFASNTNDHDYQIEQTPSGWSTETLKEQVSSTSGSQYQTFQIKGLTIFFTSNNSATWVDRGVLFSLKGDSGLSGDQIAQIAASM